MSDLETVVREVAPDYYYSVPNSTRSGVRVFLDDMLELLHTPGLVARAREAAGVCEADYPVLNPTALQESLRAAIIDRYIRTVRQHPRLEDQAAAFADTIIAAYTPDRIEAALQRAARMSAASEHLIEIEQARWREMEIARNRRKPPRKAIYRI